MSNVFENHRGQSRLAYHLPLLGLTLAAVFSLFPILVEPMLSERPLHLGLFPLYASTWAAWGSKIAVVLAMFFTLGLCAWMCRTVEPTVVAVMQFCFVLAGLMTAWHWIWLDVHTSLAKWQLATYLGILNHSGEAPHQFRPLPYGFTRSLEWITHNWFFSFVAYRWFFNAFQKSASNGTHLWHSPERSLLTLNPLILLYPLSIWYYFGQLTDPLSHALFVLALIFAVEDRWLLLAISLGLGVLAKETVIIMVPAYWACWWRKGWPAFAKTAGLGVVCVAAFLAARLPYGWRPVYESINGAETLMLWENLGIGEQQYDHLAPTYANYLHPALFILIFLPFIAVGWRRLDGRLKALCLTLAPLLFLSSLLFGWLYESRNYMPLAPLLATSALLAMRPAVPKLQEKEHH